ncbi:UNVERIFIED_CONTAM: hypothetical protein GTU68_042941, partial [Idotea baltica]|nr:hypothetical protein [Idotea baltica]
MENRETWPTERVRGALLLQTGLLRRVARGPFHLPANIPGSRDCNQPQELAITSGFLQWPQPQEQELERLQVRN